jgi:ATP-dependent Clp protease ATP-binding subunit ClpB
MDLNTYTNKAQQALLQAKSLATEYNHNAIEPAHILAALLMQEDGVVPEVVAKIGARPNVVLNDLQGTLDGLPRISGSNVQVGLSREASQVLTQAEKQAGKMRDEYISTEHVLLALVDARSTGSLLNRHSITQDAILQALTAIRGGQRVTTQDPEGTYQSLEKYGRDLTTAARRFTSSAAAPRITRCSSARPVLVKPPS